LVVRVKLRIKGKGKDVETSALVNSVFEAVKPQLVIPLNLAETLNLTSLEMDIEDFDVAGGGKVSGYRIRENLKVELVVEDRNPVEVEVLATALPREKEVIISDYLASSLGIVILDPRKGEWCLQDEVGLKRRPSTQLKEW